MCAVRTLHYFVVVVYIRLYSILFQPAVLFPNGQNRSNGGIICLYLSIDLCLSIMTIIMSIKHIYLKAAVGFVSWKRESSKEQRRASLESKQPKKTHVFTVFNKY